MGGVCSVLMSVVTLQSFKMIGRPEVRLLGVVHDLAAMLENCQELAPACQVDFFSAQS